MINVRVRILLVCLQFDKLVRVLSNSVLVLLATPTNPWWHVPLQFYSISFKDFAVKISVAEGTANRLARDRANHQ